MIDTRLTHPPAALETLMSELKIGESQPELWEGLHGAAARDGMEAAMGEAYRKISSSRRLRELPPDAQAHVLMHAANFFQGLLGDRDGAASFLERVLEIMPENEDAFRRLENRAESAGDKLGLVELYAKVVGRHPNPPDEVARKAINLIVPMPAKTPVSDDGCRHLVAVAKDHPRVLDVLEAHCKKTDRAGLAAELIEQAIGQFQFPDSQLLDLRHRAVALYTGEAGTPGKAIDHVEGPPGPRPISQIGARHVETGDGDVDEPPPVER